MADETLGSLGVDITGDYSDLSTALDQATQVATDAGASIASAFQQAANATDLAGGSLQIFQSVLQADEEAGISLTQSLTDMAGAASTVGDAVAGAAQSLLDQQSAATDAASSLESVTTASSDAASGIAETGNAAQEAEGGLSGMVEQLTLLGEALAITEGLREFGQEALTAYGTVQSVTIGLTALTGSAEDADAIIGQIKDLAATEPFAFPDIAPTVQRMVALGVSAEQIPGVMQAVADTSAATGNAFANVANMLDRMALSGTANSRALATLGISAEALNTAMGAAGAGVDATTKQITAAFAALPDQATRIGVLETALSKFSGTAIAEAQGISGQWQIFQNQFEEVMVSVGELIAPVVGDILNFGKSMLSGIQEAVEAIETLPTPVRDTIVVIGLLAAAVVPLTAAMSAFGLGVIGIQGALPALNALMDTLGITAGTAAGEETALAGAEVAVGVAATGAAPKVAELAAAEGLATDGAIAGGAALGTEGMAGAAVVATDAAEGLATGLGGAGVAGAVGAVVLAWGGWKLGEWASGDALAGTGALTDLSSGLESVWEWATKAAGSFSTWALGTVKSDADSAATSLTNLAATIENIAQKLPGANIVIAGLTPIIAQLKAGMDGFNLDALSTVDSVTKVTTTTKTYDAAILGLSQATAGAAAAQTTVSIAVSGVQANLDKLSQKLYDAQAAYNAVKSAQDGTTASANLLNAAHEDVTKATNALNSALGISKSKLDDLGASMDPINLKYQAMDKVLDTIANASTPAWQKAVKAAVDEVNTEVDTAYTKAVAYDGAWLSLGTSATSSGAAIDAAGAKAVAAGAALQKAGGDAGQAVQQAMNNAGITIDTLSEKWETAVRNFGPGSDQAKSALNVLQTAATTTGVDMQGLADAINKALGANTGLYAVIANGHLTFVQQIADMDQGNQSATGLGTAATGMYTALREGHAPSTVTVGDMADLATAFGNASSSTVDLGYNTDGTKANIVDLGNHMTGVSTATSDASEKIVTYGEDLNAATVHVSTATTTVDQYGNTITTTVADSDAASASNETLAGSFQDVTNSATQATQSVDAFNAAAAQGFSAGPGGKASSGVNVPGQGYGLANTSPEQFAEFSNLTGTTIYGAFVAYMDGLTKSLGSVNDAAVKLNDTLTGHSLAPALDETTVAAQGLESVISSVSTTATVATTSLSAAQTALKALTSPGALPTAPGPSAGDPATAAQLATLASGGSINTQGWSGQQLAALTDDVNNYTAAQTAYQAALQSWVATTDNGTTSATLATASLSQLQSMLANVQGQIQTQNGSWQSLGETMDQANATTDSLQQQEDAIALQMQKLGYSFVTTTAAANTTGQAFAPVGEYLGQAASGAAQVADGMGNVITEAGTTVTALGNVSAVLDNVARSANAAAVAANTMASAPSGTSVSPTQIDTPFGQAYLTPNGWELLAAEASGPVQSLGTQQSISPTPSLAQIAALLGPAQGMTASQWEAMYGGGSQAGIAGDFAGPAPTGPNQYTGPQGAPATPYGSSPVNITFNANGITPGNSQQMFQQFTTNLRQIGIKVT